MRPEATCVASAVATFHLTSLLAQPLPLPAPVDGPLLGGAGGIRPALAGDGVSLGLQDIMELFDNPTGGRARGIDFDGQFEASLGIDLGKAVGLDGGLLNVSSFETYGHGISASHIDNLNLVSSVEAVRSFWLYELWLQQAFLRGSVDVRVGQLGADQEFMVTRYGAMFVNSSFGWPELPAADLPSGGGPAYSLATPAVRLRIRPADPVTILLAAFNGNPAGPGLGNPEKRGEVDRGREMVQDAMQAHNNVEMVVREGKPSRHVVRGKRHPRAGPADRLRARRRKGQHSGREIDALDVDVAEAELAGAQHHASEPGSRSAPDIQEAKAAASVCRQLLQLAVEAAPDFAIGEVMVVVEAVRVRGIAVGEGQVVAPSGVIGGRDTHSGRRSHDRDVCPRTLVSHVGSPAAGRIARHRST